MNETRRLKLRELPWLSKILRYTLEDGTLTLWLDLRNGEQGLYVTRDQRACRQFADGLAAGWPPTHASYRGSHHISFAWTTRSDFPSEADEQQRRWRNDQATDEPKPTPSAVISALQNEIIKEMDRIWGKAGFGGGYGEYAWLLQHYGITEEEDVRWINILVYNAGELSSEDDKDEGELEDLMQFLTDDQAVSSFLEQLLQKYRNNTITYVGSDD